MEYKHICEWCEKEFISYSSKNKFCSLSCSTKFRNRKRNLEDIAKNKDLYNEISSRKIVKEETSDKYVFCINNVYAVSLNDYTNHSDCIRTCKNCKKKFINARNNSKFCSEECFIESRSSKIKRKCKCCGKEFLLNTIDKEYVIFCSNKCKQKFYNEIDKADLKTHEKLKCICINCGKVFYPIEPIIGIKYCSSKCEREFGIKKKLKTKICKNCGKKFLSNKSEFCSKHCSSSYSAKNIKFGIKIKPLKNGMKNKKHSLLSREKMSNSISLSMINGKNNPCGHFLCGYVKYVPHYFRSSWELNFAIILLYLKRDYRFEARSIKLESGKRYLIDFYDVKRNIIYEIKGGWIDDAKNKINLLLKSYPNIKIHLIDLNKYVRIYKWFNKKIKLIESVTPKLKNLKNVYSVEDARKMLITKEEHELIYGKINDNAYKKWDKEFDKRLGLT